MGFEDLRSKQERDCYACAFAVFEGVRGSPNSSEPKTYKVLASCLHEPMSVDPGLAGCHGFVRHEDATK